MPESVFYFRGLNPPVIDALVADPSALKDLKAVATLGDELVSALRDRLMAATGLLDPKALAATVRSLIDDENIARSVLRTVQNLTPGNSKQIVEALAHRQEEIVDFPLDKNDIDRLRRILPKLIQPYSALTRFKKAKRLANLTGQELESIELICDLRPVFDEDRKHIECMMPYTRLHIVATGADGLPKSFEAELTHQQVIDLRKKAAKAQSKLNVLRKSVESWITEGLPDLPLTRVPLEESSDA